MNIRSFEQVTLDKPIVNNAVREALKYALDQSWIKKILRAFLAIEHADKFVVMLIEIEPAMPNVPVWNWIVSGDVPCAYVPGPEAQDAQDAVNVYLGEMAAWVEAVKGDGDFDQVFPIEVPRTRDNAVALERRIAYIAANILKAGHEK